MANEKRQGPLQRLIGSVAGMLIGAGLFLGSFLLLWVNEGRVDLSKIAVEAAPISAAAIEAGTEGRLVAATGLLTGDRPLGDSPYLRTGPYLSLERVAEMYAWEEEEEDDDGSTSYSYSRVWTTSPQDSSGFRYPEGHTNPPMRVQGFPIGSIGPGSARMSSTRGGSSL